MKSFFVIACSILLINIGLLNALGADTDNHSMESHRKFVPDKKTAIAIAVAVANPIYGEEQIKIEAPYNAVLQDGIWTVTGSFPSGKQGKGGVFIVKLASADAKIVSVSHGR